MSFDFLSTKRILRKLGGDKIPGTVLTWDGDTSGAIEAIGEQFVKLYDKYMDLSKVASVRVVDTTGASFSETVPSESLIVQTINEDDIKGLQMLMATVAEEPTGLLLSIPAWGAAGLPEGVYVFAGKSLFRAETITFAETIVPIDPKYLPGVCLPVVEIADVTNITAEESAKLTACMGSAIIFNSAICSALCSYYDYGDEQLYTSYLLGGHITTKDGVTWTFVQE